MKFTVITTICVFACLSGACGVHHDDLHCGDLCDGMRVCNPSLADAEWDDCYENCRLLDYSGKLVDCVLGRECEGAFDDMIKSCFFDPLAVEEDCDCSG